MASIFKTCACPNKARCNHSWIVRYREPGGRAGRPRQHSFPAKRQATAFAARIEADKVAGTYLDPARAQIPFADYAAGWLATRILRPTTIDQYVRNLRNHTLPAFGHLPLASLTRPLVQAWIKHLTDTGLNPRTIANIYGVLAGILRTAVIDGRLSCTPATGIQLPEPLPTTIRLLEPPHVQALAAAMRPRYALTVLLAYGTGTRQGETFAASRSRINPDAGTFTVDRQIVLINTNPNGYSTKPAFGPPKTRAGHRTVPVPRFVTDAYREHIATHTDPDQDLLFTSPRTRTPLHRGYYREAIWIPAIRAAGLPPDTTFHDLRHSFASTALAEGVPLLEVSRWLGHATITETADTYGHLLLHALHRTPDALDRAWATAPTISPLP
jgi:integrase